MEREITDANEQGLGLIGSIQMLIGAPTSNRTWWPDINNGGPAPVGKLRVSPLELETYVDTFLEKRDSKGRIDLRGKRAVDAIMVFRWDRNNETDWQNGFYDFTINQIADDLQQVK